jgi:hypothetical protein
MVSVTARLKRANKGKVPHATDTKAVMSLSIDYAEAGLFKFVDLIWDASLTKKCA